MSHAAVVKAGRYAGLLLAGTVLAACTTLGKKPAAESATKPEVPVTEAHGEAAKPPAPLPPLSYPLYRVKAGETLWSIAMRFDKDFRELARINKLDDKFTIYADQALRLEPEGAENSTAPAAATTTATTAVATPKPAMTSKPLSSPATSKPAATTAAVAKPAATVATTAAATATAVTTDKPPATAAGVKVKPAATVAKISPSVSSPVQASAKSGSLAWGWPVTGQLLKRFSSEGVGSKGIDIAGKRGDPVKAAADGVVVYAGEGLVGYGKLIILRHNDEYISAYAHNDRLIATEGQRVKLGQTIAEVGSTGAERDKLHFEIRFQGRPVDPLGVLPAN